MAKDHAETPGRWHACACQWTGPCLNDPRPGVHDRCHMGVPMAIHETLILERGGQYVAAFAHAYRYPTASATGWSRDRWAYVWLADRTCRWVCACDCGHPRGVVAHDPKRNPARPAVYELVPLPGLELPDLLERSPA